MVALRYYALVMLAACAYGARDEADVELPTSIEQSTRGLRTNTGHIIFQSISDESPTSSAELSTLEPDSQIASPSPEPEQARQAEGECMAAGVEDWDRGLQTGGVFIILVLSFIGAMLPVMGKYVTWLRNARRVFVVGKFFGAGVILATSFVHMMGAAIETLGDSCLDGWLGGFDSWPALLAMLALLAMHLMEHTMGRRIAQSTHRANTDSSTHSGHGTSTPCVNDLPLKETPSRLESHEPAHMHAVYGHMDEHRKRLSTYVLELGIALHSIIVGVTLAVTGGTAFKTLLAAISFHQFFEGMALGTRVAALTFHRRPFLICMLNASIFALTTPLGQVIGIAVRESFAPRAPSSLLAMGVLDAVSAGILLYSAVANLLVEEFSAFEFHQATRKMRIACFAAMYTGCAAMSVIGKWA
ncbi:hypothetical protein IW148_000735 [Coemansia sp. RSA 1199]|nr:hypothetical protein IW148_000735 [Coemansia sp. RSA 1199]